MTVFSPVGAASIRCRQSGRVAAQPFQQSVRMAVRSLRFQQSVRMAVRSLRFQQSVRMAVRSLRFQQSVRMAVRSLRFQQSAVGKRFVFIRRFFPALRLLRYNLLTPLARFPNLAVYFCLNRGLHGLRGFHGFWIPRTGRCGFLTAPDCEKRRETP